ncbi:MAG TPA: alpha-2-macroglobulin family protein, partial [Kofleriaceae bacterium]|nr:alpha-2-macroglobulin family protein [Kofleriaceae bacterium]
FYPMRGSDTRDAYSRSMVKLAKPARDQLAQNGAPTDGDAEADGLVGGLDEGRMGKGAMARAEAAPSTTAMAPGAPPPPPPPPPPPSPAPQNAPKNAKNKDSKPDAPNEPNAANGPVALRTNFNPLAAFSPTAKTDANGKVVLSVKLPDNLTRYRVVALAAAGERNFGKGESAITARLPLMVRPSPPRFLNFGDTFKLPVVLQNQTDNPMTVKLAMRASNATLTDGAGREVMVPANDRVEVQFPAAAEMAGTARFQFVGASGSYSDAAELALPVWTPATTEAFATYGVIDDGAIRQPVALPGKVVTQFGGLEVTTASTNLQALTDAVLYIVSYPFECAEQRASRILAIASLRDVLTAFNVEGMPTPAEMEGRVAADLERLTQMQNGDGGFAFWERGRPSWPFLTTHVANALVRAKLKGYSVPANMLNRAMGYLKNIESHYDVYYSDEVRWSISSYALYVRKLNGDVDVSKAQALLAKATLPKLPMEATGWLLGTLAGQKSAEADRKAIVRHVMNKVSETAGAANFTTAYKDGAHLILSSDRRVDGIMLESLIQEQKDLDLIPKVVTGLLAHRKAGRWLNTGENAFALLALDLYFRTYEKVTPDFVARLWLG